MAKKTHKERVKKFKNKLQQKRISDKNKQTKLYKELMDKYMTQLSKNVLNTSTENTSTENTILDSENKD